MIRPELTARFVPQGLLVVKRHELGSDPTHVAGSANLTKQDVRRRYRGFEGLPWPDEVGARAVEVSEYELAPAAELQTVLQYFGRLDPARHDYIGCDAAIGNEAMWKRLNFEFLGYDYGHAWDDDVHCSILFSEVIYGPEPRMRRFSRSLNDHLLLPSLSLAQELDGVRDEIVSTGGPTEDLLGDDYTGVTAIYGRSR